MRKYHSLITIVLGLGGLGILIPFATVHAQGTDSHGKKPVSVSLSECSAMYILLEEIGQTREKDRETLNRLEKGANSFLNAAYEQAQKEGRDDPRKFINENVKKFIPHWNKKMATSNSLNETKDLMQYCRALGTQKKILPLQ